MLNLLVMLKPQSNKISCQIWFQNRRQNDRRRSRPLPPHELLPSGMALMNSQEGKETMRAEGEYREGNMSTQQASTGSFDEQSNESDGESGSTRFANSQETVASTQVEEQEDDNGTRKETSGWSESEARETNISTNVQSHSGGKRKWTEFDIHELVNSKYARRSLPSKLTTPPSLRISLSFDGEAMVRKEGEKTPSPPKARDSLRISLSADGEAVVRAPHEPSPPKTLSMQARQAKFGPLRRSTSAISFPITSSGLKNVKPFGRSRDAHAWELHCDNDARTALSSALSTRTDSRASLSRQGSRTEGLKPLGPRTNLPNEILEPETATVKRKKLTRAVSSVARLETETKPPTTLLGARDKMFRDPDLKDHTGDSDKENWIPGTQISSVRKRNVPKPSSRARGQRILGHSSKQLEANNRPDGPRLKRARSAKAALVKEGKENQTDITEGKGDVSAFMKGASTNPEEDLDCVQGLLSLSQGAWR